MRIKPFVIIGIILFIGFVGCHILKGKSGDSKESQKVIHPRYGTLQTIITTPATVLPKNRLEIKPTVPGRIEQVLVKEGQMVKIGEILAWMSSTDRAALLDSARGQGEKELKYWQDAYKPIPLLAPINGQVIVAITQPGQTVTITDPVLVLSDQLIVRAQVDETDIGKIQLNQSTSITLDAYPDSKIDAVVDHMYYESKTVNNVTVYEVDLRPSSVPPFFRSGMNATVDFIVQRKENILLLPVSAIHKQEDESFVWINKEGKKPIKREVQTGMTDDKNIEIVSGLKEEDEVILKTKKFSLNKSKGGGNPFMAQRGAGRSR
jgi:membrane fusion protein, macrolide-specific efflux system